MALSAGDLPRRLTTKSGSAGNTLAQTDANLSIGGYPSTTAVGTGLHELFPMATQAENAAGKTDFRCITVCNISATDTAYNTRVWFSTADPAGGMVWTIGAGTLNSALSSATKGIEIANDTTAPAGVTFSAPTTRETGISLGDIAPGCYSQVWIRCVQGATSTAVDEQIVLSIQPEVA